MRIVHTSLRYPPATGGVETHINNIVDNTRSIEDQRDVRVLTSNLRTHHPATSLDPNLLLDDPMHVQRLHHSITPHFAYPRLQALSYYISHHQPDILHTHSFWYQPADTAARYARHRGIPLVFNPYYYENQVRRKPLWQLYKKTIGQRTFSAADVVVVISPYEQQLIEEAGFKVKRFELIPPGIDTESYEKPHSNIYQSKGIAGNILLTASRLAPGKGLDEAITSLAAVTESHPDTHLVIVGEDFGAQSDLEAQAESLGLSEHTHFLGKLSDQDLVSAYQHATIFLHPSHYEAFGIVLAESLAGGTPVVARNIAAIPFVAPHDKAALLFNNQDELVTHINTLLSNQNLRETLATQGQQHVQQNFTLQKLKNTHIALYESLLDV